MMNDLRNHVNGSGPCANCAHDRLGARTMELATGPLYTRRWMANQTTMSCKQDWKGNYICHAADDEEEEPPRRRNIGMANGQEMNDQLPCDQMAGGRFARSAGAVEDMDGAAAQSRIGESALGCRCASNGEHNQPWDTEDLDAQRRREFFPQAGVNHPEMYAMTNDYTQVGAAARSRASSMGAAARSRASAMGAAARSRASAMGAVTRSRSSAMGAARSKSWLVGADGAVTCPDGYTLNTADNMCDPIGYTCSGDSCLPPCPQNSVQTSDGKCTKPFITLQPSGDPTCAPGDEPIDGTCYGQCYSDLVAAGNACRPACPEGYLDEGATCRRSEMGGYMRKGYVFKGDCERDNPAVAPGAQACEKRGFFWRAPCKPGYTEGPGGSCYQSCPGGWSPSSAGCVKPTIQRPISEKTTCPENNTLISGKCYAAAPEGYQCSGAACIAPCPADNFTDENGYCVPVAKPRMAPTASVQQPTTAPTPATGAESPTRGAARRPRARCVIVACSGPSDQPDIPDEQDGQDVQPVVPDGSVPDNQPLDMNGQPVDTLDSLPDGSDNITPDAQSTGGELPIAVPADYINQQPLVVREADQKEGIFLCKADLAKFGMDGINPSEVNNDCAFFAPLEMLDGFKRVTRKSDGARFLLFPPLSQLKTNGRRSPSVPSANTPNGTAPITESQPLPAPTAEPGKKAPCTLRERLTGKCPAPSRDATLPNKGLLIRPIQKRKQ